MEIRTLYARERLGLAAMLDAWPLAEGWSAGDRLRALIEYEPSWSDENVFVAIEQDRIVSTVTILPRPIRILGHTIPAGGLAGLYTDPAFRRRGIASALLERACDAMRGRGLELALVFPAAPPATTAFFEKRGFSVWAGQRTILRRDPKGPAAREGGAADELTLEPVGAGDERVLQSVKSIHAAYAASRSGIVARDDGLWKESLAMPSGAREEFWIARRGGLAVAYARASIVDDVFTITEFGRFEDGADALAKLVASLLEPREEDPLIPAGARGVASDSLRAFLVAPTFDDIGLTVALEHRAIRSHPMEDASACFRCVNLIGLASRLDVDLLPDEDGRAFLRRILPPDAMVFWPSDRF